MMQAQIYQHMLEVCTQCYDENILRIKCQQKTQTIIYSKHEDFLPPTLLLPMYCSLYTPCNYYPTLASYSISTIIRIDVKRSITNSVHGCCSQ